MKTDNGVKMPDEVYERLRSEYKHLEDIIFFYEDILESGTKVNKDIARRVLPRLEGRYEELRLIFDILFFNNEDLKNW